MLQELDGAFLSYKSGHASYLNPSIREFVATVISEERDTVEDLLVSAVRFKQAVNVSLLGDARPESVLAKFIADKTLALKEALRRLLFGPSTRWEKTPRGTYGYSVDMGEESRIEVLMRLAERQKSKEMCGLAAEAAGRLVAHWNGHVPNFHAVLGLLRKASAHEWFLKDGNGLEMCRRVLAGMLDHLWFANASEWLELLTLPSQAPGWTTEEQSQLDQAFKRYCESGVSEERRECSTEDEMNTLIESLTELGKKTAQNFSYHISLLSESIAEREERASARSERVSFPSGSPRAYATDEDVRQMFSTLRDKS